MSSPYENVEVISRGEDTADAHPDPHVYEFILNNPVTGQLEKEIQTGFLYVTGAFVGVGVGDGEVRYVVPLGNLYKVTQLKQLEQPVGSA